MSVADLKKPAAVGIGEVQTAGAADPPLIAYGLGSCVGVSAHDPVAKVGGMAHVMLPDEPANGDVAGAMPARYAGRGVSYLIEEVERIGGVRRRLVFKLAGGAKVLTVPGAADRFDIGHRNADAIRRTLTSDGFKIAREDLGGHKGRTVRFDAGSGELHVRQVGDKEDRVL